MEVTIAICAFNAARRLEAVLEALSKQEARGIHWEVLLVDNASTDGTGEAALELGRRLGVSIRVVAEAEPGLSNARRRAAVEARGEILSYIDDDNIVEPDWVSQCVAFVQGHPRAGVIGGVVYPIFVDPASKPADFDLKYAETLAIRDLGTEEKLLGATDWPPCGAGMTGRTEAFRAVLCDVGLHLSDRKGAMLSSGGDTEIGILVRRLGWETWYAPGLKLGHVLPPQRFEAEYSARLDAGLTASGVWLRTLIGFEPPRSRAGYGLQAVWMKLAELKLRLARLLKGPTESGRTCETWARRHRALAEANLALCLDNPYPRVVRRIEMTRSGLRPASVPVMEPQRGDPPANAAAPANAANRR